MRSPARITVLVAAILPLVFIPVTRAQTDPAAACAGLVDQRLPNTTITAAQAITGGSFTPPGSTNAITNLPPFCRVAGVIEPTSESHILFEVWLPLQTWNGRFVGVGNGGWAGTISFGALVEQIRRGYASASTNTGHEAAPGVNAARFAFEHPEQLIDFAYRAHHETTLKGKALVRAFYGKPPEHSYWIGCSSGGYEGLMEAQRFPSDYDGIVAGAPANNWTRLMAGDLDGILAAFKDSASNLPPSALGVLHRAALAACDSADGVVDGVLEDPRRCRFDPAALQCAANQTPGACLTPAQVEAARRVYRGLKDPITGAQLYPGLAPGSEPFWPNRDPANPFPIPIAHYKWLVVADPNWDWRTFQFTDPAGHQAFLKAESKFAPILNATDPNLREFRQRGGKLLQYHGWNDQLIAPQNSIDYYESVISFFASGRQDRTVALGEVQSFYRLFMAPGMAHCSGGPGPNSFDMQAALEQWVERGIAPEEIIATHSTNGVVDRLRPLCPYPKVAVYKGNGDTNDAANFICRDPSAAGSEPARPPRHQVLFNRYQTPVMTVFIADADGKNERALVPSNGLEYSPSYSADAQWVVFTGERAGQADIYRIHPDGTGLEQLTDHPAFDDQGALSPDGKMLAFVSTRGGGTANIWLLDLGSKKTTNLTANQSGNFRPSWSPDGRWIAFTSDRDSQPGTFPGQWEHLQSTDVYLITRDGKGLRRLTRKDGVAGSPSWSADGRNVLFYETDEVGAYLAKGGNSRTEIVSIEIATGVRTQHTASNETKLSPAFLPDGRISYVKRAGDDTGGLRIRHPTRRIETVIRGAVRNPSWSPDGARVVYQRISRLGSTEHLVPTFSPDAEFELLLSEPFPSFSPDGKKLLYSQYGLGTSAATGLEFSSPGDTSIEVMTAQGSDKRTLFHREGFSAFSAVWAPAGNEIALSVGRYFRAAGLPPAQIALVKPDGSDFRLIVDDEMNNGFPSWSPDGTRLVFKRGRQLVIMGLANRQIVALTDGSHYDNFPQWSPRGDAIMFTSDRDGDFELYTIRPDGTGLRRVTNVPGNDAHSSWCAGGDWIVFSSSRRGFKDEMALYDAVPQPNGEIFAMRADGSDVRQLTDNKWEDSSAACKPEDIARFSGNRK